MEKILIPKLVFHFSESGGVVEKLVKLDGSVQAAVTGTESNAGVGLGTDSLVAGTETGTEKERGAGQGRGKTDIEVRLLHGRFKYM